MVDNNRSDRETVRVSYRVLSKGLLKSETRIFSSIPAVHEDALSALTMSLGREHPGCEIRIDALDHILTGSR